MQVLRLSFYEHLAEVVGPDLVRKDLQVELDTSILKASLLLLLASSGALGVPISEPTNVLPEQSISNSIRPSWESRFPES